MRLLLTIDYKCYLFPETTDTAALLSAIASGVVVEEHNHTYPKPSTYSPKVGESMDLLAKFIPNEQIVEKEEAVVDELEEMKSKHSKLHIEHYDTKKKIAELEAKVAELSPQSE